MKIKLLIFIIFLLGVINEQSVKLFQNNINSHNKSQILGQTKQEPTKEYSDVSLIVTGDVLLARTVNYKMVKANDFAAPFAKTAEFLKSSDLTLINLETPLIKNCPLTNEGMIFCGDQRGIEGLKYAGVDLVGIANNHILNYGQKGKEETIQVLEKNNLTVIDENKPVIVEVKNKKFGFIAYDDTKPQVQDLILISNLKKQVDYVIVFFHWGTEYTDKPNSRQVGLAHVSIDNGADLVLGNHPHWVQEQETYQGKLIAYSHGNFIFDQMWSQKTREGVVGKYTFDNNGLKEAKFYPVLIEDYWQPHFLVNSPE